MCVDIMTVKRIIKTNTSVRESGHMIGIHVKNIESMFQKSLSRVSSSYMGIKSVIERLRKRETERKRNKKRGKRTKSEREKETPDENEREYVRE